MLGPLQLYSSVEDTAVLGTLLYLSSVELCDIVDNSMMSQHRTCVVGRLACHLLPI
jgi:hypothetical protein